MAYNVEKSIDSFGKEKLLELIHTEGLTQVQVHKLIGLSDSNSRMHKAVYKRIYRYLGIDNIPYKNDSQIMRKFKYEFDKVNGKYWQSDYIVECLIERLKHPTINYSGSNKRLVISFPKHPHADPSSNQIKAHIVVWELDNEQYVPDNHWVIPVDNNYTNLDLSNLILVNKTEHKHEQYSGTNNPGYKHGMSLRSKHGGWQHIAKNYLLNNNFCRCCGADKDLLVHHIINYHLFTDFMLANSEVNLMPLCRSCHTKIHYNNTNIKVLIEETQYSKLLELLETLKSQVPDTLMETYKDVEKQLGLTDNQQPSTV